MEPDAKLAPNRDKSNWVCETQPYVAVTTHQTMARIPVALGLDWTIVLHPPTTMSKKG